jgi:hypothetical protein
MLYILSLYISENNMGNRNYSSNEKLDLAVSLKDGLDPEILAYWYRRIEEKSREIAPTHLKEKLCLRQDRILWMKFELSISKRAVPYLMQAIEEYIEMMPYSTSLYFRNVQQIVTNEVVKQLR